MNAYVNCFACVCGGVNCTGSGDTRGQPAPASPISNVNILDTHYNSSTSYETINHPHYNEDNDNKNE